MARQWIAIACVKINWCISFKTRVLRTWSCQWEKKIDTCLHSLFSCQMIEHWWARLSHEERSCQPEWYHGFRTPLYVAITTDRWASASIRQPSKSIILSNHAPHTQRALFLDSSRTNSNLVWSLVLGILQVAWLEKYVPCCSLTEPTRTLILFTDGRGFAWEFCYSRLSTQLPTQHCSYPL